jgi:hypothetical protein
MLGGGATSESRDQSHERKQRLRVSKGEAVLGHIEAHLLPMPSAGSEKGRNVGWFHGKKAGAPLRAV